MVKTRGRIFLQAEGYLCHENLGILFEIRHQRNTKKKTPLSSKHFSRDQTALDRTELPNSHWRHAALFLDLAQSQSVILLHFVATLAVHLKIYPNFECSLYKQTTFYRKGTPGAVKQKK